MHKICPLFLWKFGESDSFHIVVVNIIIIIMLDVFNGINNWLHPIQLFIYSQTVVYTVICDSIAVSVNGVFTHSWMPLFNISFFLPLFLSPFRSSILPIRSILIAFNSSSATKVKNWRLKIRVLSCIRLLVC